MSDTRTLMTIENLINMAMGLPELNIVNYKMIQTVLHNLARQMRVLEKKVEIRSSDDVKEKMSPKEKEKYQEELEDRELDKISSKEKQKYLKTKVKKRNETDKTFPKEKKQYLKEKGNETIKMQGMSLKERKIYLPFLCLCKEENKDLELMSPKEKEHYFKDKERENKELPRITPEEKVRYLKDKENEITKIEKMTLKERDKYLNDIEKRHMELMSPKEMAEYLKDKEKQERAMEEMAPKEKEKFQREKEEYLLGWEKYQTGSAAGSLAFAAASGASTAITKPRRIGSIDIVNQSEFKKLEDIVMELKKKVGPLPMLKLPDSRKLRSDLAKGTASLTDTMEAMQVSARVQAVEKAIGRMAELLTQLAVAGALPQELANQFEEVKADLKDFQTEPTDVTFNVSDAFPANGTSSSTIVTQVQMDQALLNMKKILMDNINLTAKQATTTAQSAFGTAKIIAEKLEVAVELNKRIDNLHSQTTNYAEQLASFEDGFTIQILSFKEHIEDMKTSLEGGLVRLAGTNNIAETVAMLELTERYKNVSSDQDRIVTKNRCLVSYQQQLNVELLSLTEAVEKLQDQKSDRDELSDGLRDKGDNQRLEDLLTEEHFEFIRSVLMSKLSACHTKFARQESTWISALKELSAAIDTKVNIVQLLVMKHEVMEELQSIQKKLAKLAIKLGEPKAAMLTRLLSEDGYCGLCQKAAMINAQDTEHGLPPLLPSLRPPPEGQPCGATNVKEHICHRWAGGSHTLVSDATRETAPAPPAPLAPSRRYTDYGSDGKLYKMAEDLHLCIECNMKTYCHRTKHDIPEAYRGGGDGDNLTREPVCGCPLAITIN